MRLIRRQALGNSLRICAALSLLLTFALVPARAAQARPPRKTSARAQFERAEKLRTALNGKPQKERSVAEYKAVISAYRRVHLTTPQASEVTPSLVAIAEIYQAMGRQFDSKYYQSAIDTYQFLLHEYPTSRYRHDALFTIARIQQEDLDDLDAAKLTFEDFLNRFPRSAKVEEARKALAEIAAAREQQHKASAKEITREREKERKIPLVTSVRYWNAENYTRVVVDLEEEIRYESARISNPDRIYFDMSKAKLSSTLAGKTFEVQSGFLKTIRVAQNQAGVVRMVLEVDKVKDYSAFLLPNPYRLVVDVHGEAVTSAKAAEPAPAKPPAEEKSTLHPEKTETARAEPAKKSRPTGAETPAQIKPPQVAKATRSGQHSLTRALGLKIGRIVIDAGHGGDDTGTIGPSGLKEKDLCLDVALRLGKMIQEKLPGTEVYYTREDDTFVPLENRTALANQVKADMFVSIHANSSRDHRARGVETYYLNFTASEDALEVAARENALSQNSIHELQDLIKKIAKNEKIEESRELATEIQQSLAQRLQRSSRQVKNRGVKRAPFVVLIGANMPSVLAEISFLSNPLDERALKKQDYRNRVVEGLYRGVQSYLASLNSLSYNPQKFPLAQGE